MPGKTACLESSMHAPTQLAPLYEALFRVSDSLRSHRDIEGLLRVLPFQLHPILDFEYMSVFLNRDLGNEASWYVLDTENQAALTLTRDIPVEQAHVSWAFENQQPAVIQKLDTEDRFSGSRRLLIERGLQSGCAVPITTAHRRIGVLFLGSECTGPCSEEGLRFLSFVVDRIALALDGVLSHQSCCGHGPGASVYTENLALREEIASTSMFEEIVGSSEALNRVLTNVTRVAPTDATVLITGESGTGKELIARAIHKHSKRSRRPFVRVNCAAIPSSLIASELFGYEKGAFTGATQRHLGRFEVANGGTIFLDEIGEIPAETQIALLRVLQERELERVGGTQPVPIDVRVIAATNRDLRAAVNDGSFRLDLFYRLNVFPMQMPSLRERPEDVLLLATYFIERYANKAGKKIRSIERKTLEWLQDYDWPGNIRELQNVVERAVILCDGKTFAIDETWLQPEMRRSFKVRVALAATMVKQEKELIEAALEETRGRISGPSGAALKLGISRTTLESKIKSLQINKHEFKSA
jgi:transcriptional regulator with GAF, ATPase, and Fis domain